MQSKRIGKYTVKLSNFPSIVAASTIVGPLEGEGPLRCFFDTIIEDELWGEKSWEKAESKLQKELFANILAKGNKSPEQLNYVLSGDLLNQCIAASFGLRGSNIPFLGLYGACSTMAESMSLGAMLIDGGFADNLVCMTSSHFCSAEKQFRFPLELGAQRNPTSQWTVTGAGGVMLSNQGTGPFITHITTGKIVDMGVKDASNMGAAMAPAAVDTIYNHFRDTGRNGGDYDLILTGDLGKVGKDICVDMLRQEDYDITRVYDDCGVMIYHMKNEEMHSGGSGCGCSAAVFSSYIYDQLRKGIMNNVLFVATGALHNTISTQQGESIPCIAHAVSISTKVA